MRIKLFCCMCIVPCASLAMSGLGKGHDVIAKNPLTETKEKGIHPEKPNGTSMELDSFNLDEVVVTGQGSAIQRRRLSSNITKISTNELQKMPSYRIDQMLQTALPNVQITLSGGQPGTTSIIKSRGLSSAFSNSTPVIYIDGVRVDNLNTGSILN